MKGKLLNDNSFLLRNQSLSRDRIRSDVLSSEQFAIREGKSRYVNSQSNTRLKFARAFNFP